MSFTHPSIIHPDSKPQTETTTKRISDMSTAEIRQRAIADGLKYYEQQYRQDPHNPQAKAEYENYVRSMGKSPDAERNRLYDLPLDELRAEFEKNGAATEATDLDAYRTHQAKVWLESRPEFEANPQNAGLIEAEVNRLGLRGSVYEIDQAFWNCVRRGEIVPNQIVEPVALPSSRAELYEMPLDELKKLVEETSR